MLRSPVQGRPTIAWAAAYHKEAEKWERRARKKAEKAEVAGRGLCDWAHQRYDDCEGKNYFPDDIEKSLRRDLPILRGRRFVVFQNAEDLIYCFVEEMIEVLLGMVMMRLAACSGSESRVAWRKATARQSQDSAWKGIDLG